MKLVFLLSLCTTSVLASNVKFDEYSSSLDFAQVTDVIATQSANGSWCFATSVRHNDQGWQHYADGWEVLDVTGAQLGYRKLHHPHEHEQPFTRSLCNIKIPEETSKVFVRAKCNTHGYGGKGKVIELIKS